MKKNIVWIIIAYTLGYFASYDGVVFVDVLEQINTISHDEVKTENEAVAPETHDASDEILSQENPIITKTNLIKEVRVVASVQSKPLVKKEPSIIISNPPKECFKHPMNLRIMAVPVKLSSIGLKRTDIISYVYKKMLNSTTIINDVSFTLESKPCFNDLEVPSFGTGIEAKARSPGKSNNNHV